MGNIRRLLAISGFVMALAVILSLGCSPGYQSRESMPGDLPEKREVPHDEESGEHSEGGSEQASSRESTGEHAEGAGHEEGPGPGEESGQALALGDVYDTVRNGARLKMVYDPESDSFKGAVGNVSDQTLCRVRVEVHLSNGTELGPTEPADLSSGRALAVELPAAGETFDGWSGHAETSPCDGGEGAGEHGQGGEHSEEGEHAGNSD